MEKLRFTFAVLAASDGKTNVICITSIETPDGRNYNVPDEMKPASKHTGIVSTEVFTKVKNSLKKRHQIRKLWIPLSPELKKIYLDEGENLQFGDQYLDEIAEESRPLVHKNCDVGSGNKNLGKTSEKFLIEKFSGKNSNVNQWIGEFENECERFEILQDTEKIETLKHLLEKQCHDWYTSMLIKFTVNSEWTVWKNNFTETYGNKGWSQVKYAFAYKFQAGSALEYATKKERLLLEVNKHIDTQTMINLIATGLPDYILGKIDKESITSTASLFNEIGKFEHTTNKHTYYRSKRDTFENKGKSDKYQACKICENLNKGTRYHPEEKCWFKKSEQQENKRNHYRNINNTILDLELNDKDPKN